MGWSDAHFRSTYATGMLRRGFDVRTVQHWMGHKSLETTMRYLAPATDVQRRVGPGDYPVPRQGRRGAPKVRRARDPFVSEGASGSVARCWEVTRSSARSVNLAEPHFQDGVAKSAVP